MGKKLISEKWGGEREMGQKGGWRLMGAEFQCGTTQTFRRWMVAMASPPCERAECHRTVRSKMVKMVGLTLRVF